MLSSMLYLENKNAEIAIGSLPFNEDIIIRKFDDLLENHNNKNIILNEMKNQHKLYESLQKTLAIYIGESKKHYREDILLSLLISVIFSVIGLKLYQSHRK